jgi:hypothetical protein
MPARQILSFPGTAAVPGNPLIDVSEAEIAVCNIDGLVYWPGMAAWDVPPSKDKFLDRVDDAVCPTFGAVDVSTSFAVSANGKSVYNVAGVNHCPIDPDFSSAGSFTVGVVVRDFCGFGSYGDPTLGAGSSWYISSENSVSADTGKLRFSLGDISGTYGQYLGRPLAAAYLTPIVFIVDRATGTVTIRANGAVAFTAVNPNISTKLLLNGLRFGAVVSATNAHVSKYGHYAAAIAFNRVLAGDDLAALERMLAEVAA